MPWHGGQKPPPHKLCKHCQLDLTNTYKSWGETRITSQSGSGCWTQLHGHRPLHRGEDRVPQRSSTIEGGEGGGAKRFVSGSERFPPRSCELLMHFQEKWYRRGVLKTSVAPTKKSLVQTRRSGTRWRIPHEPSSLEREQQSTSGRQGEHRRKRVVYPVLQRSQPAPTATPPAAKRLRGQELLLGKPLLWS